MTTTPIEQMREELIRRNYAETTIYSYTPAVRLFANHIAKPLDQLGPDDLRSDYDHLLRDKKLAVNTVVLNICALRFLYIKILKRRDMKEDLPYPKKRLRLPVILGPGEVAQLIGAARNLYHHLILPKRDRDNLVTLGLSSRAVFTSGRSRVKTLSPSERKDCLEKREEFFSSEQSG